MSMEPLPHPNGVSRSTADLLLRVIVLAQWLGNLRRATDEFFWAQSEVAALGALLATLALLLWRRDAARALHRRSLAQGCALFSLLALGGLQLALALEKTVSGTSMLSAWTLAEYAVRIAAPWLVAAWLLGEIVPRHALDLAVRAAIAATFAIHGVKALLLQPSFIELIALSGERWLGGSPNSGQAAALLRLIGTVDLAAAAAFVVGGWRVVAQWMVLWGVVTACSRVTAHGWTAYGEVLARAANGGLPLVWLLWQQSGGPAGDDGDA